MLVRQLYYLRKVLSNQKKPYKDLIKIQEKMLRSIIEYCYRKVPFYHFLWKKTGISPYDIRKLEDIKKLPIINKETIRKEYWKFISIDFKNKIKTLWSKRTSGSTGNPVIIPFDPISKDYLDAIYLRALLNVGYKPYKPLFYYWYEPFKETLYTKLGFMRKIFVYYKLEESNIISLLLKVKPEYIYMYGGILYSVAKKIVDENIKLNFTPKVIVTHGEIFSRKMIDIVEEAFNTENIFDEYGTSEFNRVAWQCKESAEYHVDADSVVLELLDMDGEEVGNGELGRVVITGLVNRALPLIRYDMGDIAIKRDYVNHSCNITLPQFIKSIEGRRVDFIQKISPKRIIDIMVDILADLKGINKFQVCFEENKVLIKIQPDNIAGSNYEYIKNLIKDRWKEKINIKDVDVVFEEIPKTRGGKRPMIVNSFNFYRSSQYKLSKIFMESI